MIGYVTIGARDVEASLPFWDAVFSEIGYARGFFGGGWAGYGPEGEDSLVFVCPPADGNPARGGNGIMIAFKAPGVAAVKAAHAAGLAKGGTDEGGPGPRPADSTTFFGAYLRDPTGNKICLYCRPEG